MIADNNKLYRSEAIQHAGERSLGSTMIGQPLTIRGLTLMVLLLTAIVLFFLSQGEYARKETVSGYLRPDSGISRVFPRNRGVADAIHVHEGDIVKKGEPLISINTPYSLMSGEAATTKILAELLLQKKRLKLQVEREVEKTHLEVNWYQASLSSLQVELTQLEQLYALQDARTAVSEEQMKSAQDLQQKGFLSNSQWLTSKALKLSEEKELVLISQRLTQIRVKITAAFHRLTLLPVLLDDSLESIKSERSSLNRQMTELRERSSYLIKAPIGGKVTAISVSVGDSVLVGQALLSIVPENSTLFAWLLIPSRATGLIEDGQRVRLMYDSFPHQQFGTHPGEIVYMSDAVIKPGDIRGPVRSNEPVFLAKVALQKKTIEAYGEERALHADMLVTADIIQAKRSILEWMLDPLLASRGRTW